MCSLFMCQRGLVATRLAHATLKSKTWSMNRSGFKELKVAGPTYRVLDY